METETYLNYYREIKELINKLGIDRTDDYLLEELSTLTKEVTTIREEIDRINESINRVNNSDEIIHLKHDLNDKKEALTSLLDKLMTADMMYICYKEYKRKKHTKDQA